MDNLEYEKEFLIDNEKNGRSIISLGIPSRTNGGTNMYWVGDLNYYLKGNVSISTGFYYFLGSFNGDKIYKENHSAYLGACYHFKTNNHLEKKTNKHRI